MITRRLARPLSALSPSSWVCPSCAQTSLLERHLPQASTQKRSLHRVPRLDDYDATFQKNGVSGLFTDVGFSIGWMQYQGMIIRKLNELTSGESTNEQDVKSIAVQFARDPMQASLFNHASMAHNNHFFYSGLSTDPVSVDNPSNRRLHKKLEDSFGSIDTLRTTMLDTAAAMFGPGFVWLVWARNQGANISRGDFRILTTYLAGTPYPEAGFRRQGIDTNTTNPSTYNDYRNAEPVNTAGAFGSWSAAGRENSSIPPGGTSLMPVLCVNTWEHVYIYDYGLLGKRKFLADWWDAVDWSRVDARVPAEAWREFEGGMRSRGGLR